jgi:FKBP-type peptidyl-prolyl cis-trans isomerase
MARRGSAAQVEDTNAEQEVTEEPTFVPTEDVDVDIDPDSDAEDEVVASEAAGEKPKATKKVKEKARGDLPDGFVTPVGLAKVLTERGLGGQNEDGSNKIVPPQVVYSYIKNAPADSRYPGQTVQDSLGKDRDNVVEIEAGCEWWKAKNERAAARKANAAAKAAQKAEAAKKKAEATPTATEADSGPVEEAE